jgi:hypothetical protein
MKMLSSFTNLVPIPKNATNTVYVEGIPIDAKEREVARKSILPTFRHLPPISWIQVSQTYSEGSEKWRKSRLLLC